MQYLVFRRMRTQGTLNEIPVAALPSFSHRHIGLNGSELESLIGATGYETLDALIDAVVPEKIRFKGDLGLAEPLSEAEVLRYLRSLADLNSINKSYIGLGYYPTVTPPAIQRNILENPGWYTAYTPYQAEIAQGRLEALLNFQTMVVDLTGMEIANASLLDEATAAAEAMALCFAVTKQDDRHRFFVANNCHPQTIAVVRTRAEALGIEVVVGLPEAIDWTQRFCGVLVQYPGTDGKVDDYRAFVEAAHAAGSLVVVAADLLSLTLLVPPGEFDADVCVGSSQRFGVPIGFGGPHAAFFATRDEFKRHMPGRLVGVSKDSAGRPAYRLALQTREQHIRRDKATSNICTAQVLLAVIAATYALYHGPDGLRAIATEIRRKTELLAAWLSGLNFHVLDGVRFDTIKVHLGAAAEKILADATRQKINFRFYPDGWIGISLDETVSAADLDPLAKLFDLEQRLSWYQFPGTEDDPLPDVFQREAAFRQNPVFNSFHTETELMLYLKRLENRDLSLTTSMIPLGSCTMKLNAAVEMLSVTWPGFGQIHPFAPREQTVGYRRLISGLEDWLAKITGFASVTVQPNAGSQGEYAGLLTIRRYHEKRGEKNRNVCLIPTSAHGTNPASAAMAGFQVVTVLCDSDGNIDLADLEKKAALHQAQLGALMVTYPSTHGVFEEGIIDLCEIVHRYGGQVYMDGANLNALVGLCRPADLGAEFCNLNLHKTFCIPHGGGGPGVGPIGVKAHLAPYLPTHPFAEEQHPDANGPVSAAPFGS